MYLAVGSLGTLAARKSHYPLDCICIASLHQGNLQNITSHVKNFGMFMENAMQSFHAGMWVIFLSCGEAQE